MTIIQPQLWNGIPLIGTDGLPVVDPACCCGEDCPYCVPGTFSNTSAATVQLSGTIIAGDCVDCQSQMVGTVWELPKVGVDASGTWERCCYYLSGNLGCNSPGRGFDWMEFCWEALDPFTLQASLIVHYNCDFGGGTFTWTRNYSWDSNNPNQHDCSAAFSMTGPTNADSGCSGYFPCSLLNLTANIGFI